MADRQAEDSAASCPSRGRISSSISSAVSANTRGRRANRYVSCDDSIPAPRIDASGGSSSSSSSSTAAATIRRTSSGWGSRQGLSALEILVCGSIAGAFSKTMVAPVDRVRILFQVSDKRAFSLRSAFDVARQIVQESGPQGLWRGNVATLWRVVPFSGIQFLVWDAAHTHLKAHRAFANNAQLAALLAGASAGVSATIATYPLDLLRARQAVGFNYKNYPAAVEEIVMAEGPRGLFKGLAPTVMGMLPYSAVSFSTFEALKCELRRHHGVASDAEVPVLQRLVAGSICGATAQLVAYPLHIVRRRMQVQKFEEVGASGSLSYASTRRALKDICHREGIAKGLYKSLTLSWLKGPFTVGLAFVSNDILKSFLTKHNLRDEGDMFAPLPSQGVISACEAGVGEKRQLQAIERLVCGGVAGSVAKSVIAPGDRIKILYQTDREKHFTWRGAYCTAKGILGEQGPRGLWRGHSATLLRVAPYSATSFAVFDPYKGAVRDFFPGLNEVYVRFLAGAGAGMTATSLTYPFDLFRARMAAHRGAESPYDGYLRATVHIVRNEGGPRALFSGLRATLLGIVPYSGITFCLFETFKAHLVARGMQPPGQEQLGTGWRLGAGALSGLLAQSATYPLDIVRRRMQVSPHLYRNEAHAMTSIFQSEGARGLYKGLSMNWIKGPIAVGVSFTVNDFLRDFVAAH